MLYTYYKGWIIMTMSSAAADDWLNTATNWHDDDHILSLQRTEHVMAGRGGCSLQSSVLAISVLYLLVLGLLLALAAVLALDPGPGLASLLELADTADSRIVPQID